MREFVNKLVDRPRKSRFEKGNIPDAVALSEQGQQLSMDIDHDVEVEPNQARLFCQRFVSFGIVSEGASRKLHRPQMLRIVRAELDAAFRLLNDLKLVAFSELEAGQ
jgi:hypothetical protein